MPLLSELRAFLASWLAEVRGRRDYRAQLDIEAAQDITADLGRHLQASADLAFAARVADDEALAILGRVTAPDSPGGRQITAEELPAVILATRHIRRSSDADHRLAEHLAAS